MIKYGDNPCSIDQMIGSTGIGYYKGNIYHFLFNCSVTSDLEDNTFIRVDNGVSSFLVLFTIF